MQLKYSQLAKNGDISISGNWLLVTGGEEHFKRLLAERLHEQLLRNEDSFNFELLDLNDRWEGINDQGEKSKRNRLPSRVDRIISMSQELPFLGNGRLLIVRNIELLPTDQQKKLAAALPSVPPMNHVLLITGESEKNKQPAKLIAELLKGIDKTGVIFDCSPLTEQDAGRWINETLAEWGQKIEPAALHLLLARAGTDMRRVQIELEKLSLLAGEKNTIRQAQVEMMTPKLAEESVFHLTDAVATRDTRRALAILYELMEEQLEPPQAIFPLLSWQFRLIGQTKILLDAGWTPKQDPTKYPQAMALLPEQNALKQIGGWMGGKLATRARQMSWEQLSNTFQALLECDMAGKAIIGVPQQDMKIALELLCVKLCQPAGRA